VATLIVVHNFNVFCRQVLDDSSSKKIKCLHIFFISLVTFEENLVTINGKQYLQANSNKNVEQNILAKKHEICDKLGFY